jgi:hypothetical protein
MLIRLELNHPLASMSTSYNQNIFYIAYHAALCASIEQLDKIKGLLEVYTMKGVAKTLDNQRLLFFFGTLTRKPVVLSAYARGALRIGTAELRKHK